MLQKNTELKTNSLFLAEIAEFALLVVPFASLLAAHSDLEGKKRFVLFMVVLSFRKSSFK